MIDRRDVDDPHERTRTAPRRSIEDQVLAHLGDRVDPIAVQARRWITAVRKQRERCERGRCRTSDPHMVSCARHPRARKVPTESGAAVPMTTTTPLYGSERPRAAVTP